jgi:uncharacterized membrane protein (DUF4010 family)
MARLHQQGISTIEAAAGSILLATVANLVVKAGITVFVGGRALARRVLPALLVLGGATLGLLAL